MAHSTADYQEPFRLDTHQPRRKPAFALTPLADIMFQLLIFFMLSTTLAPYALIPLGAPAAPATANAPANASGGGSQNLVIWHVGAGEVRAGQSTVPMTSLPQIITQLKAGGLHEILLFTSATATMQDVATVIEAIRVGEVPRVRLIGRPGGG
jgi:biopolymer transport protein ExbD